MEWKVHSERTIYVNRWLSVNLADVELPDGRHLDHYLLRQPPVALTVVVVEGQVLLLWRHRFITGRWGYELPAGVVDEGETPIQTAARETLEETGYQPGPLTALMDLEPAPGLGDCVHHVYLATHAEHVGAPEDSHESERVEWVPLKEVPHLIERRDITAGSTVAALLYSTRVYSTRVSDSA